MDKQNLEQLYMDYADTVYRFLRVKTGSSDLAEELTQETFFQAAQSIDRFDYSCQFSTWLIGIAKNVLRTHYRKHSHAEVPLESAPEPSVPSAEETVSRQLSAERILKMIHKAEEPGREILYMRILGDLSFRQIGEIFGQSENWARINYFRAKQRIVREMEKDETDNTL